MIRLVSKLAFRSLLFLGCAVADSSLDGVVLEVFLVTFFLLYFDLVFDNFFFFASSLRFFSAASLASFYLR